VYQVFALKYRPQRFEEVVGQAHIARTLQNAVRTGRVAHAYLFCGSRGIGKTSMARILAKALNCVRGPTPEPCCECDSCRRIAAGEDLDVMEIDGASNRGIDEVRELRQKVAYAPARSRFKVYYVDEVHMLTQQAFNALLKTLEEPPAHVKFIFSTTDPQQLPDTVKSRCQRFDFRRISEAQMVEHLRAICQKEGLNPGPGALAAIARAAQGSLRDALGTLEQVAAFSEGQVKTEDVLLVLGAARAESLAGIVDALARRQTAEALALVREVLFGGVDLIDLIDQLCEYLRDLLVAHYCGPEDELLAGSAADAQTLASQSAQFSPEQLIYMVQVLREARLRARRDTTGRLALEIAIIKLSRLDDLIPLEEALERDGAGVGTARAEPTSAARPAGGAAAVSAAARRIREKLLSRSAAPSAGPRIKPEGAEGGAAKLMRFLDSAANRELADQARNAPALLKAFEQADQHLGLRPLALGRARRRAPEGPEREAPEQETEQ